MHVTQGLQDLFFAGDASLFFRLFQQLPADDAGFAAFDIFVERDVEFFDQRRITVFDEPGHVFAKVLAGFGHVVSEPPQHLVADAVGRRDAPVFIDLVQKRIQILAAIAIFELEVKGHVIDAGDQIIDVFVGNADVAR